MFDSGFRLAQLIKDNPRLREQLNQAGAFGVAPTPIVAIHRSEPPDLRKLMEVAGSYDGDVFVVWGDLKPHHGLWPWDESRDKFEIFKLSKVG